MAEARGEMLFRADARLCGIRFDRIARSVLELVGVVMDTCYCWMDALGVLAIEGGVSQLLDSGPCCFGYGLSPGSWYCLGQA